MNCINCDNPIIENKELQLCASCNLERRKAERNSKKVKVVHPVKKVSFNRAKELEIYAKKRKAFLLHKMACEFKFQGCSITATDIHHTSLSALNFLNENTWMSSCRFCHSVCENMPSEERRRLGYLID